MDADDEDPDSARPAHPVFYGFWPRFTVDDDAGEATDAGPAPGTGD
ncbi:MAG TPA: hypothetical protein VE871_16130 [Longimicrobium sp.]|nr:hypothetical protein [Longimicrobium sp.]